MGKPAGKRPGTGNPHTAFNGVPFPPDAYWVDRVDVIDLYQTDLHRAAIYRPQARVFLYDADGHETTSFTFLWSECPYCTVETRLQIGRIDDVFDASEEGNGTINHSLRAISERNALTFRQHYSPVEEVDHYLERALAFARLFNLDDAPGISSWKTAISTVKRDLSDGHFSCAMKILAPLVHAMDDAILFGWQGARADCVRALEALQRLIHEGMDR